MTCLKNQVIIQLSGIFPKNLFIKVSIGLHCLSNSSNYIFLEYCWVNIYSGLYHRFRVTMERDLLWLRKETRATTTTTTTTAYKQKR